MVKNLSEILIGLPVIEIIGNKDIDVIGLAVDSRKVEKDFLFIAVRGTQVDGHKFIGTAISQGAKVIVCEQIPEGKSSETVFVRVENSQQSVPLLAASFYGNPSQKLKVVGVTGTNGKTSIVTLLFRLFKSLGYKSGLISTIKYFVNDEEFPATHTTPDAINIQELLNLMVEKGCEYCFMEVSSHAIHQSRIDAIKFAGGIFTNLTHDHLDYHKTFAEYIKAKKQFFDQLPKGAFALTNIDDKNGRVMVQNTKAEVLTYSTRAMADFKCKIIESHFDGSLINFDGVECWTKFVGKFNAYNILAVMATAVSLGQSKEEILMSISNLGSVAGRFELIRSLDGKFAIVDYAHTPDALKNVLDTINDIRSASELVITVVGAGGDRDKTKRPEMANEAVVGSDKVILTSDNPRTENPATIIADMEKGVEPEYRQKVLSIENRREAIKTAVMLAKTGDIILIAGKGHENYQEVNGVRHHFDDKETIEEIFGIN